jgi:hypothetical protein
MKRILLTSLVILIATPLLSTAQSGFDAQCVANTIPQEVEVGKQYQVSITLKNTGTEPWSPGKNVLMPSGDNSGWILPQTISTGPDAIWSDSERVFSFNITAPDFYPRTGKVHLGFQLFNNQTQTMFGDICPDIDVVVLPPEVYNASLTSQSPKYTGRQIPFHPAGYQAFSNAEYVSGSVTGGSFVVTGTCNNAWLGGADSAVVGQQESGGQYIFDAETGAFKGKNDVCFLTTSARTACNEGGGCNIGWNIISIGKGQFIRQGNEGYGHFRSPLVFQSNGNGAQLLSRLFMNNFTTPLNETYRMENIAFANGILVGNRYTTVTPPPVPAPPGFPGGWSTDAVDTAYYSMPGFEFLTKSDLGPSQCSSDRGCSGKAYITTPALVPLFGVGNILVAVDKSGPKDGLGFHPTKWFVMPSPDEIALQGPPQPGGGNTFSQLDSREVNQGTVFNHTIDSQNGNRIAIISHPRQRTLRIYKVENNILLLEEKRELTNYRLSVANNDIALAGEYLAYVKCNNIGQSCRLTVEKNGQSLEVEQLPESPHGGKYDIRAISISPSGKMLVATEDLSPDVDSAGAVFLYQIGDVEGPQLPPDDDPTATSTDTTGVDPSPIIEAVNRRITQLRKITGSAYTRTLGLFGISDTQDESGEIVLDDNVINSINNIITNRLYEGGTGLGTGAYNSDDEVGGGTSDGGDHEEVETKNFTSNETNYLQQPTDRVPNQNSLSILEVQQILNRDPDTKVADSGAGSPGQETNFLGPLTQDALRRFQCKMEIVCTGDILSTGYGNLGPITKSKLEEL